MPMRPAAEHDPRFRDWCSRLALAGTQILEVNSYSAIRRGDRVFAALVDTVLKSADGEVLPRCMLLRGDTVVVVPILDCEGMAGPRTLMVEQFRPIDGENTLEFVGGMIDDGESPTACAVKEVREEIGLHVRPDELISLHHEPIRVCTAMMDEHAYFFAFRQSLTAEEARALDGKSLGELSDGESITVRLVDFDTVALQPVFSAQVGLNLIRPLLTAR